MDIAKPNIIVHKKIEVVVSGINMNKKFDSNSKMEIYTLKGKRQ